MATTKRSAAKKTTAKRTASAKSKSSAHSQTTTDREQIRNWAEERGAHPACVKGTGGKDDVGMIRLDFPGYSGEKLQEISWDEFFEKFDEGNLALLYQEETASGQKSNFNKLVSRETASSGRKTKPRTRAAG
jgi:hypothetical protein